MILLVGSGSVLFFLFLFKIITSVYGHSIRGSGISLRVGKGGSDSPREFLDYNDINYEFAKKYAANRNKEREQEAKRFYNSRLGKAYLRILRK